jgi:hypothetical protein
MAALPVRARRWALAALAALAVGVAWFPPLAVAANRCVAAEEAAAHAAGDTPPKFTARFYARTFTVDASLDGMDGSQLPMSIEEVCDIPKSLTRQAVQLAGTDGLALLSPQTSVWVDGRRLQGLAAVNALDGADTALLRVRLTPQRSWGEDEDGDRVPTFTARRITITD